MQSVCKRLSSGVTRDAYARNSDPPCQAALRVTLTEEERKPILRDLEEMEAQSMAALVEFRKAVETAQGDSERSN